MITLLLAKLVLTDPYGGFRCRLHPFGHESLAPFTVARIQEGGYDMTSLLYDQRGRLIEILGLAREPATFNPSFVNLWVHYQKRTWFVDSSGTVQCGKSVLRLDRDQFKALREEIDLAVPGPERDDSPPPGRSGTTP